MAIDLSGVPEEKRTYTMCRASVMTAALQLKYVPEQLQTAELCLVAVKYASGKIRPPIHRPDLPKSGD